jgi:UDP-glucose 4-epimerase
MNILVTGGAGYIGSHAVRMLIEHGHEVSVLDNLSTGYLGAVHADALFTKGSVADVALVRDLIQAQKIEAVLHFAAHIEVAESVADPEKYYRNNFSAALTFIDTIVKEGVKKLVFSSTAAVYGTPARTPIIETDLQAPLNPYGRSKLMVEWALRDVAAAHGLGYAVLRYFNVAGAHPDGTLGEAHDPESHLIPRVLQSVLPTATPFKLSIYGTDYATPDGTCIRDYVHVQDLVRAHLLALDAIVPGLGQTYNLGSEKGFSVLEVLDVCQTVTQIEIPADRQGRRPGDSATLVASSAKIRAELGWKPEYPDLKTIVEHAWAWHRTHPRGYKL